MTSLTDEHHEISTHKCNTDTTDMITIKTAKPRKTKTINKEKNLSYEPWFMIW